MHIQRDLLEYIRTIPVIDTHEHLEGEAGQPSLNALHDYTRHYFVCDLISSGLDPACIERLADPEVDILTKWRSLTPYWELCRHTGYGQMLDLAVQQLYGASRVDESTIEQIEAGFQKLRATPGYSKHILRDVCGIEHVMNNVWHLKGDPEGGLYWFVTQIDGWITPGRSTVEGLTRPDASITSISDWVNLCLRTLEEDLDVRGAKALKMAVAYGRPLLFEEASWQQAQRSFDRLMAGETRFDLLKPMQDYTAHKIFEWANERQLVVQIHTGYQEGNGGRLPETDPSQLINLILRYPKVRFDLFHMGYPYQNVIGAMGKQLPNAYLDLCWTHILSPVAARRALGEWLQLVPLNKIFAFGGDCLFFDGVVGHLELARRDVAAALAEQAEAGIFSPARAKEVARLLFYENPKACYRMD